MGGREGGTGNSIVKKWCVDLVFENFGDSLITVTYFYTARKEKGTLTEKAGSLLHNFALPVKINLAPVESIKDSYRLENMPSGYIIMLSLIMQD